MDLAEKRKMFHVTKTNSYRKKNKDHEMMEQLKKKLKEWFSVILFF